MMSNQASAAVVSASVSPASYSAGAANGAWVDLRKSKGEILVPIVIGAVTGSVIVKVQDATDISGTGAGDITGVTTASITAATSAHKLVFDAKRSRGFVRVVATVTGGPVLVGASFAAHPGVV